MRLILATAAAAIALTTSLAQAAPTTVWAVESSATGSGVASNAYAEQFDTTGKVLRQLRLGSGFDPSGIAIVGGTAYVASASDGLIRTYSLGSGAAGAVISTGQPAYGSLSPDSTGLWANDAGGGNKAFHITFAGVNDRTVTLSNCGSYCSGIESFTRNGASYLIANRGNPGGPETYDLYTATGALVTAGLLSNVPGGTGIGYDGGTSSFYVADATDGTLLNYSFGGTLLSTVAFGAPVPDSGFGSVRFVTDLAIVVPEPMSLALLAMGLGSLGLVRRRSA